MGNQFEKAAKAAGLEAGRDLGEKVNDALDQLESKLDELSQTEDNNANAAEDAKEQEEPTATVEDLQNLIDQQNATIEKLTGIMGKMVTRFGAQVNDGTGENVNTNLNDGADDERPPLLSEIKLG